MPVTLRTIADRAGVSVPAVSYVLNDRGEEMRISAKLSSQIKSIAKELNYIPNAAARSMMRKRTQQIGILVPVPRHGVIAHPLAMETIMGINAALEPSGNVVVIIPVSGEPSEDRVESRIFRERFLDGLIMLEDVPEADESRALTMVKTAIWVNSNVWRDENCIRRDEIAAGRLVVTEMLRLGYKRIVLGLKAEKIEHYSESERQLGVESAAAEAGIPCETLPLPVQDEGTELPAIFRNLSRDTALIASDSYNARLFQTWFCHHGMRPGQDFGFACCDDADDFRWTWPLLSRVGFKRTEMGRRAAEMLLKRLNDPEAVVPSELVDEPWRAGATARPV